MHQIHISNEDETFSLFLEVLHKENILQDAHKLRVKKKPVKSIKGNKFKEIEL